MIDAEYKNHSGRMLIQEGSEVIPTPRQEPVLREGSAKRDDSVVVDASVIQTEQEAKQQNRMIGARKTELGS